MDQRVRPGAQTIETGTRDGVAGDHDPDRATAVVVVETERDARFHRPVVGGTDGDADRAADRHRSRLGLDHVQEGSLIQVAVMGDPVADVGAE